MTRHTPKSRLIALVIFRTVMMFLALFVLVPRLHAQDKPAPESAAPPADSTNRFLFVLDTSAFMRKHTQDAVNVVETILRSSASGQLHNGDTIGVWTFNEDVYTGAMPLETWSADDSEEIALRIAEFIRQQDYGKSSRLDVAMKPVAKVIKMSDIITVFIISSGASPISGTPYDDDINAQYQACLHDMGKKPMPIVTVLQGKHGKFIRYTVNALPWPVVIPELPIPLKLPNAQPEAPAPAVTSAPPAAASPSAAANTAPPPSQPPPAAPAPVAPPVVVAPPAVVPPAEFRPPASVAATGPPPAIPSQFAPSVPVAQPASPPPPPPVEVPAPAPTPASASTPVAEPPIAQTASATPPPQPEPVVKPATSAQLPLVPPRQPPLVPKTLPANVAMAENAAPAAAAPPNPPASTQLAPAPAAAVPQSASASPASVPPKTLVAQASALIKSFTGAHHSVLLIGGISLLVVASALILLMARRPRPRSRVSLITQTMDERHR
jgi:hypothetical protein